MAKLNSKINRFFYRNRDRGVRNLMLYVCAGNVVVWLLTQLTRANPFFYEFLYFNPERVVSGQIWRLFTYPLVYLCESNPIFGFITLLFFYWCGSILEQYWGTLRFNAYYLCGVLLTDLVGVAVGLAAAAELGGFSSVITSIIGIGFVGYVNLSLILGAATVMPDEQIRIWFVIPAKMKWLAWLDLGIYLFQMIRSLVSLLQLHAVYVSYYLLLLVPVAAIVNYLLFFGKQAANILPDFLRFRPTRQSRQRIVKNKSAYSDAGLGRSAGRSGARSGSRSAGGAQARFRCTVCGRTELTNPELEFRYCSRCAGYRCYCQDHIHNHTHITQ
ncbi:MAG: rhomboid family intramembrane serine protease [Oscillospiraceae bacterium]|nr:rhomboid family intramembrane serine protease [Oscillospiraceae bacterium]